MAQLEQEKERAESQIGQQACTIEAQVSLSTLPLTRPHAQRLPNVLACLDSSFVSLSCQPGREFCSRVESQKSA